MMSLAELAFCGMGREPVYACLTVKLFSAVLTRLF